MFGFNLFIGYTLCDRPVSNNEMRGINFQCRNNMIKKFEQDKLFKQSEDHLIILDGVILNKHELQIISPINDDWFKTIVWLYLNDGDTFFLKFRGSFSGVFYDKKKDKWLIFNDHIGSKFIYYTTYKDLFFCSSLINDLYLFMDKTRIPYGLNIENAYLLLTYGFMLEERTLCNRIFKIRPGCYLEYHGGVLHEKQFFILDNKSDNRIKENDAIELIEEGFKKAVKLQFQKDQECNYKHFVALSGGLDSRMVSLVAHKLGFTDQLNFTFSQSNYIDEYIPKQIAEDFKHEWIFKALDNGLWLYDLDEITRITGGNVVFCGLAHGNSLLKYINFNELGLFHSGQLGDVTISSFTTTENYDIQYNFGDGAYSKKLLNKIDGISLKGAYKNQEIGNFYFRGFAGANNGLVVSYRYTELFSPFYNIDFLKDSLSIPLNYRFKHKLYKKWILKKHPDAARYIWEKTGSKISAANIKIGNKSIPYSQILTKIFKKLNVLSSELNNKKNMNPIGFYLSKNKELARFFNSYYVESIGLVNDSNLRNDINLLHKVGSPMEKMQIYSLLAAIKTFGLK